MSNNIKIICNNITGTSGLALLNADFTYAWKNEVSTNPIESSFDNVETQMNGWENPTMNLTFHIPIGTTYANGTTYMDWAKWNSITKNLYDGTPNSKCRIEINVAGTAFTDYSTTSTATTSIPFIVKSYNLRFSPSESRNSYWWTISAQLQITK
jgi:hypothetical protein